MVKISLSVAEPTLLFMAQAAVEAKVEIAPLRRPIHPCHSGVSNLHPAPVRRHHFACVEIVFSCLLVGFAGVFPLDISMWMKI